MLHFLTSNKNILHFDTLMNLAVGSESLNNLCCRVCRVDETVRQERPITLLDLARELDTYSPFVALRHGRVVVGQCRMPDNRYCGCGMFYSGPGSSESDPWPDATGIEQKKSWNDGVNFLASWGKCELCLCVEELQVAGIVAYFII